MNPVLIMALWLAMQQAPAIPPEGMCTCDAHDTAFCVNKGALETKPNGCSIISTPQKSPTVSEMQQAPTPDDTFTCAGLVTRCGGCYPSDNNEWKHDNAMCEEGIKIGREAAFTDLATAISKDPQQWHDISYPRMDVPAVTEKTALIDMTPEGSWPTCHGAMIHENGKEYCAVETCADKSRILLHSEDKKGHCIKFPKEEVNDR